MKAKAPTKQVVQLVLPRYRVQGDTGTLVKTSMAGI